LERLIGNARAAPLDVSHPRIIAVSFGLCNPAGLKSNICAEASISGYHFDKQAVIVETFCIY
jgi:hypothetical protein